jgi:uncharacterized repeat protein (TIGR01451 family)
MKHILLFALFAFSSISIVHAQWTEVTLFEGRKLTNLITIGEDVFGLDQPENLVFHYNNTSNSWSNVTPPGLDDGIINMLKHQNNLYISAYSGGDYVVYVSADNGANWEQHDPPTSQQIVSGLFSFGDTLVSLNQSTVPASYYYSTDGAATWSSGLSLPLAYNGFYSLFSNIHFGNQITIFQKQDSLYYSSDLTNWQLVILPWENCKAYSVDNKIFVNVFEGGVFPNSIYGWVVSNDFGATFELLDIPSSTNTTFISKIDHEHKKIISENTLFSFVVYDIATGDLDTIDNTFSTLTFYEDIVNDVTIINTGELLFSSFCGLNKYNFSTSTITPVNNGIGFYKFTPVLSYNSPIALAFHDSIQISYNAGATWQVFDAAYAYLQSLNVNMDKIGIDPRSGYIYTEYLTFQVFQTYPLPDFLLKYDFLTQTFSNIPNDFPDYRRSCYGKICLLTDMDSYLKKVYVIESDTWFDFVDGYFIPESAIQLTDNLFCIKEANACDIFSYFDINTGQIWPTQDPLFDYCYDIAKVGDFILATDNVNYPDLISMDNGQSWGNYLPMLNGEPMDILYYYTLNSVDQIALVVIDGVLYRSVDNGLNYANPYSPLPIIENNSYSNGKATLNQNYTFVTYGNHTFRAQTPPLGTINGQVYLDIDLDEVQDAGEVGMPNVQIKNVNNGSIAVSNEMGTFFGSGISFPDTLLPLSQNPYLNIVPDTLIVASDTSSIIFAVQMTPNQNDLSLTLTQNQPFRPGFYNSLALNAQNVGTTDQQVSVFLVLPIGVSLITADPNYAYTSGDTLFWETFSLPMLSQDMISVILLTDVSVSIGSVVNFTAQINGSTNELTPFNNTILFSDAVVGAYDPNDKQVSPETLLPDQATTGQYLDYTIRFQNTGNYPANIVRITDSLSVLLDINTIEIISQSHEPMTWQVRPGRVLEFMFNSIVLPDSFSNEPASHGFIRFKIKTLPGLALNDIVANNADIFFDYNAPVRTNTASTQVTTQVSQLTQVQTLHILPNPSRGSFVFDLPNSINGLVNVSIFDASGKLVQTQIANVLTGRSDLIESKLPIGSYALQVRLKDHCFIGQILVVE